jgi:hypothetical protein
VALLPVCYGRAGQQGQIARGQIARGQIARGKIARGKIARGKIARGKIVASGPEPRPGLAFGKPITSP